MSSKILNDKLSIMDLTGSHMHAPTLWVKTEIIGGHGKHTNKYGLTELDEVLFKTENMVPIGGVQYAMENIFGVLGPISIPVLNNTMGIGAQGSTIQPSGTMPYPYGQRVCLFGIGCGGASENNLTALEVKYNESTIVDMIPFRYTNSELSSTDSLKYYGKKLVDNTMAYYLKKFDNEPTIRHFYKNGNEGEDGSTVDSSVFTASTELGIETLTECCLTITKKDAREWFAANGNVEETRVNSIGLFNAIYDSTNKDYANIRLFSKLNIPTEPLSFTKDMNIVYRVYGS